MMIEKKMDRQNDLKGYVYDKRLGRLGSKTPTFEPGQKEESLSYLQSCQGNVVKIGVFGGFLLIFIGVSHVHEFFTDAKG